MSFYTPSYYAFGMKWIFKKKRKRKMIKMRESSKKLNSVSSFVILGVCLLHAMLPLKTKWGSKHKKEVSSVSTLMIRC